MNRKPNIFLLLVVLLSGMLTSCVEEYAIVDEDFESKLVVNSLFDSDSPWEVEVSKTVQAFDPTANNEKITYARVEIFDQNDEFLYELYHQGEGVYAREDYRPSPKRSYSVKVSAQGFHAVTARGYVPEKSTLMINNFSIIENDKKNDIEVDFEIEDRSKLESYYIWEIVNIGTEDGGDTEDATRQLSETWINDLTNNPSELVSKDREFLGNGSFGDGTYQGTYSSIDGNRRIGKPYIFDNDGFDTSSGVTSEVVVVTKKDPTNNNPDEVMDSGGGLDEGNEEVIEEDNKITYTYELRVMSISRELYDYYSSLEEYYQNGEISHTGESPFILYSNVKNGAGIFAGFSESVIQF